MYTDITTREQLYYKMLYKSMYQCEYATLYKKRATTIYRIIAGIVAIVPIACIFAIGIWNELMQPVLFVAGAFSVLEAASRFFPFESTISEMGNFIHNAEILTTDMLNVWQAYCCKQTQIENLTSSYDAFNVELANIATKEIKGFVKEKKGIKEKAHIETNIRFSKNTGKNVSEVGGI